MAGSKQAAASAEKLVALEAVEPVQHNGEDIAPGGTFEATEAQAEALIAMGAAKLPGEAQGSIEA